VIAIARRAEVGCLRPDRSFARDRPRFAPAWPLKKRLILTAEHQRKGDRYAEGAGQVFCGRVRVRLRRVHGNRIRTSAAVYFSSSPLRRHRSSIHQLQILSIVSTDENDPASNPGGDIDKDGGDAVKAAHEKPLDSIREMNAALHTCWMPPPKDSARHGMEYTIRFAFKRDGEIIAPPRVTYSSHDAPADVRDVYRDAVNAALARCTPLHFSDGMAGAVASRPIVIRFVDNRTIDDGKAP
jgi:hypothetical protein